MLLRLLLISLLTSLSFMSRPAHAGRASACKAPPFAVPKETQRAVDAAIDARVTGAANGGASATVETRTDYETTTLTQDAAARSWTEYTLCMKLAKKLISQDLHDELLRGLLTLSDMPTALATPGETPDATDLTTAEPRVTAPAPAAQDLVGTWQVTAEYRNGSCPSQLGGGKYAYTWLISTAAANEISVSVQGNTSYDQLNGVVADGVLYVGAEAGHDGVKEPERVAALTEGPRFSVLPRTDFELHRDGDGLIGTREVATWTSVLTDGNTNYVVRPCVLRYDVRATR